MKKGLFGFFFLTAILMVLMAFVPSDTKERSIIKHSKRADAVITKIEDGKVYVEYIYNDISYESVLNFYNRFTMKPGKKLTVYIDPKNPGIPRVPKSWYRWSIVLTILAVFEIGDAVGKMMYKPKKNEVLENTEIQWKR